jgi:colanic acid/amylovoran biosynthesis glycosyltransferase
VTTVLHSVPLWLPPTSPWLWNQVRFIPPPIVSHVAAERALHEDRFPIPRLHRFEDEPLATRFAERALRKMGIRRHLEFVVRTARAIGAEIVHSHWGDAGWRDVDAAGKSGARHVVSFYGKDVQFLPRRDPRWRSRYRDMFARVDRVLCEGPHFAATLRELGCPDEKIRVQPLGVESDAIEAVPRRREPADALAILVAASFREKKGIPDAVEAAGRLARSGVRSCMTIIGDASDDPRSLTEKARIEEAIARHRDVLPVRLLGYCTREELLREAYDHDVLLAPSREAEDGDTEGGAPVVLVDAAATGMPIVATRHADIPAVVIDGVTGLLAAERDVEALSELLGRIASEPGLAERLGTAGRARVEACFDVRVLGRRLAGIYEELAEAS